MDRPMSDEERPLSPDQEPSIREELRAAAGGKPEHIVSMQIFVTDGDEYRGSLEEIGERWRRHFDRHYPAISLLEVKGLFDPGARVELMCTAVIPEEFQGEESI